MHLLMLTLCVLIPVMAALDCRKFSFAPACRGIMLKRGDRAARPDIDVITAVSEIEKDLLKWIVMEAESQGVDCIPVDWIKSRLVESRHLNHFSNFA